MENNRKLIGQRIRDERNNHKWLISELSKQTGLSVSHISSIERGKCSFSIDGLVSISNALEIDVNYLLFGRESKIITFQNTLLEIISDCNRQKISIIIENAQYLKNTLRKNSI